MALSGLQYFPLARHITDSQFRWHVAKITPLRCERPFIILIFQQMLMHRQYVPPITHYYLSHFGMTKYVRGNISIWVYLVKSPFHVLSHSHFHMPFP